MISVHIWEDDVLLSTISVHSPHEICSANFTPIKSWMNKTPMPARRSSMKGSRLVIKLDSSIRCWHELDTQGNMVYTQKQWTLKLNSQIAFTFTFEHILKVWCKFNLNSNSKINQIQIWIWTLVLIQIKLNIKTPSRDQIRCPGLP